MHRKQQIIFAVKAGNCPLVLRFNKDGAGSNTEQLVRICSERSYGL